MVVPGQSGVGKEVLNSTPGGAWTADHRYGGNGTSSPYDDANLTSFSPPDCGLTVGHLSSPYFQAAVYLLYGAIFLAAVFGNGLVCHAVRASPRMRTVTNYFIANLAVGDMLMTVFCVPFSFVSVLLLQYWPFGTVMCYTVSYSQALSVFVSAYTLVAISVDRYMAIMWPLKPRMGKRHAKAVILLVWLVAVLTVLPTAVVSRLVQPTEWHVACGKYLCVEDWLDPDMRSTYSMVLMILQYVLPLTVLIFTYVRIALVVWGKQIPGEAENSRDQRMARSKRKVSPLFPKATDPPHLKHSDHTLNFSAT